MSSGGAGATGTGGSSGAGGEGAIVYPFPYAGPDEDGSQLWLRYPKLPSSERLDAYTAAFKTVVSLAETETLEAAKSELLRGLGGLLGATVPEGDSPGPGAVVLGAPTDPEIAGLALTGNTETLGPEGYLVERVDTADGPVTVIVGQTDVGVLYGTFALLRHLQRHLPLQGLLLRSSPKISYRLLNHWDNPDGSIERGYSGQSIWQWNDLPSGLSPRYEDYARANASLGINGVVLNNVNANSAILSSDTLEKVQALADVFRPYGIRVYLTARFSAPIEIGGLGTANPIDQGVQSWWQNKVDEIYSLIPDFGGFQVKANSEGQPGPGDYDRSHADGANMLAEALAPHGGTVFWRAFVYDDEGQVDRIRQAHDEFAPLDGQFLDNVFVQPKNGPLDFQPREPIHPLFGSMPSTPLALELQITKEYLGNDTHLAYLGPLFEEVLQTDTFAEGQGSSVARVIDGTVHGQAQTAIAGVANVGDDANWTGSHFNQANWYVYGRMAWDPDLSSESIAEEWVGQTFSNDPALLSPTVELMMASREALVSYMTPLGLVHIMASEHHYGPGPWVSNLGRPEWNPTYYHNANPQGLGFDRTASGSNAVEQYFEPLASQYASRDTVPEEFLLFFHHVGWTEVMQSGRSLWEELVFRYSWGVDQVQWMRESWASVEQRLDQARFQHISTYLEIQHQEARWWRDACLAYFAEVGQQQIPAGYAPPVHPLSYYQDLHDDPQSCPADVTRPRCPEIELDAPSPTILP